MSSHGGQQNFPFGYRPESIHGLGLPEFMTPGPPPGQPLLNAHENQDLETFFHDFDQNAVSNKNLGQAPYNLISVNDQYPTMPPMFVGSDTSLGSRTVIDPHQLQAGFSFDPSMIAHNMAAIGQPQFAGPRLQPQLFNDAAFPGAHLAQLSNAAAVPPAYGAAAWPHAFAPHSVPGLAPQGQQAVHFGTDVRFRPSGYAAPNNPTDPDMPQAMQMHPMDWFEPNSASTTQPNTQPNTEPSSPNWAKKRTFEDFQQGQFPRNGFNDSGDRQNSLFHPSPSQDPRRKRDLDMKQDQRRSSRPPTPSSRGKPAARRQSRTLAADEPLVLEGREDGEDDEDNDDATETGRSTSPAPWPASRARPPRNPNPPTQSRSSRKKKTGSAQSTPIKPKAKVQRASSVSLGATSARKPLTLEQKKANHTNSEQRRRDATARAYAELYDLVPELDEGGKQSTMKKLEVVVAKVQRVKQRVEDLRAKLGLGVMTDIPLSHPAQDVLLDSNIAGWQQ